MLQKLLYAPKKKKINKEITITKILNITIGFIFDSFEIDKRISRKQIQIFYLN